MNGDIAIKEIVARVKMDLNESTSRMDMKLTQYAIDCLTDMRLYIMPEIAVRTLEVQPNMTAELPNDFMRYRRIAVVAGNRMCVLKHDHDLALRTGENSLCDEDFQTSSNGGCEYGVWGFNVRGNQYMGEHYGRSRSANIPRFRLNTQMGRIELQSNSNIDEIVLEYVSTGDLSETTLIGREYMPMVRAYIHYQLAKYDPEARMNQKQLLLREYEHEADRVKHLNLPTPEEFLDAIYSAATSSPR